MVFLDINDAETSLDDDAAFSLVLEVAQGALEVPEIAARLDVRPRN